MKNKIPDLLETNFGLTCQERETINGLIAYLQEKEDIAKKNRLEAFTKAGVESAKRVKEKEENEIRELIPTWDELHKAGKSEIIRVPDEVVFTIGEGKMSLMNGYQGLSYEPTFKGWRVDNYVPIQRKMQLIKCNYDDIEVGDFFYSNDSEDLSKIHELEYYSLKLGENYMYWRGNDILSSEYQFKNYYKITPIQ